MKMLIYTKSVGVSYSVYCTVLTVSTIDAVCDRLNTSRATVDIAGDFQLPRAQCSSAFKSTPTVLCRFCDVSNVCF